MDPRGPPSRPEAIYGMATLCGLIWLFCQKNFDLAGGHWAWEWNTVHSLSWTVPRSIAQTSTRRSVTFGVSKTTPFFDSILVLVQFCVHLAVGSR